MLEITKKSWSMGGGERSKDEDWAEIWLFFLLRWWEQNLRFGSKQGLRNGEDGDHGWFRRLKQDGSDSVVITD